MVFFLKIITIAVVAIATLYYTKNSHLTSDHIQGRRILITGASSGIGEALVYEYAKHGASVFITARREDRLQKVVQKCREFTTSNNTVYGYFAADMKNYKHNSKLLVDTAMKTMGGIDTIILNHAYMETLLYVWTGSSENLENFDAATDVNYKSMVYLASYALQYLRKCHTPGRIGIIGSVLGKVTSPLVTTYCGSKFALDGFFSSLQIELEQAGNNITVSYGAIGLVVGTDMNKIVVPTDMKKLNFDLFENQVETSPQSGKTAQETAYYIMLYTENGIKEYYYPYYYTSLWFTIPSSWISIVRHIAQDLIVFLRLPKEFYEFASQSNHDKST